MSLTKVTYSMIAGASVSVLDYGAVGDGTTDDTAAVQSAATAAAGAALYIPAGYTFIVKDIALSANTYVYGAGKLKLKVLASGDGSPIFKINGNNITIDGIAFDGNKAAQPADGFHDSYAQSGTGLGRAYRAAINTGPTFTSGGFTDLTVQNCSFVNTYGSAFASQNCTRVRFLFNTANSLYMEAAFIATSASGQTDIQVIGNKMTNIASGDPTVNPNGILVSQADRIVISDNIIYNVERDGIKQEGGNYITISNNVIQATLLQDFPGIAVQANDVVSLAITGNTLENVQRGIQLNSAQFNGVTVTGNVVKNTTGPNGDGLQMAGMSAGSSDITVSGNTFAGINATGIYLVPSANRVKIVGNQIYGKANGNQVGLAFSAVGATTSDAVTIENNTISNFVQSASSDGVFTVYANVTLTNFVFRGNTVLAGSATNRAVTLQTTNTISGVFDDNFIDGLITGTQTGFTSYGNKITGTTSLTTGTRV